MADVSTKPYFIRAIYEWCSDCGYTPYLSVRVDDLEIHALLVEHDAAAVAEGIGDPRVERHHFYFTSFQYSFLSSRVSTKKPARKKSTRMPHCLRLACSGSAM